MSRYRWFQLQTGKRLAEVVTRLGAHKYTGGANEGFLIEASSGDRVQASFVERISISETVFDPLGRTEEIQFVEYRNHEFSLSEDRIGFEIKDSGRTHGRLVTRLLEVLDYDFTIIPLTVDPLAWVKRFQELAGQSGHLDKLQVGSVKVTDNTVAQVAIKGEGDIIAGIQTLLGGVQNFDVERATLKLATPKASIVFQKGASVAITSGADKHWLGYLRASLAELTPEPARGRIV